MDFRTEFNLDKSPFNISYTDGVFCMGSCFSEEISKKLNQYKFQCLSNPFGTLFHPLAIENALSRIYTLTHYTDAEIYQFKDIFFSWDHSTAFSKTSLAQTKSFINQKLEEAHEAFSKSKIFILTLGTAFAYEYKEGGFLVANCHKLPAVHFEKKLLSPKKIHQSLLHITHMIHDLNPKAQIIFTVSPVRHLRDGFVENNRSKSHLIAAVHSIINPTKNINYFPSYEWLMDDLRDYRFYAKDMVHPNELALDYIWEKFQNMYFAPETQSIILQIKKLQAALDHRPQNPNSSAHLKFLYETMKSMEEVNIKLPGQGFNEELKLLKNKLHEHN